MRKVLIVSGVILALLGIGATSWFITNKPARSPAQPSKTVTKAPNPTEHTYMDVDYARKMIVHNQQGVKMADIAKENAVSEEVRSLAARISSELSANTERYINWLMEWNEPYFNLSDYPEMDGHDMYPTDPGMASLTELSALETATSGSVDELFLRLMIAHHEGAAEIAKGLGYEKMQFGQIISLKNETLKKQAEEIQTMKQLEIKGN